MQITCLLLNTPQALLNLSTNGKQIVRKGLQVCIILFFDPSKFRQRSSIQPNSNMNDLNYISHEIFSKDFFLVKNNKRTENKQLYFFSELLFFVFLVPIQFPTNPKAHNPTWNEKELNLNQKLARQLRQLLKREYLSSQLQNSLTTDRVQKPL